MVSRAEEVIHFEVKMKRLFRGGLSKSISISDHCLSCLVDSKAESQIGIFNYGPYLRIINAIGSARRVLLNIYAPAVNCIC